MPDARAGVKRVLLVDDEPSVIEVLTACFARFQHGHAYEIETASNGTDGYLSVLRVRPDLVVLDMTMPGMDGLQLLKQIRALDARLPVIMVTANEYTQAAADAQTAGVFAYVPKPFDVRRLEHLVALVFSTPHRERGGAPGGASTR